MNLQMLTSAELLAREAKLRQRETELQLSREREIARWERAKRRVEERLDELYRVDDGEEWEAGDELRRIDEELTRRGVEPSTAARMTQEPRA